MSSKGLTLVIVSLILIGLGCSSQKSEIDGTWFGSISGNNSGALYTFVFAGSEVEITRDGQLWYKGTFSSKRDVSPKQADFAITESPSDRYVGKKSLAIYELRKGGEVLVIAGNEPGVDVRPTSFEVEPGSGTAIFILERSKTQNTKTEAQVSRTAIQRNKDALINHLNNLAAFAYQYRIRPSEMGGGSGRYTGLKMSEKLGTNENGTFTFTIVGPDEVKIKAVSKTVEGAAIEATIDKDGRLGQWTYFGKFM